LGARDVLGVEIGAALAILGLLLVFLPLFIQAAASAADGHQPQKELRARTRHAWAVAGLVALAAVDGMLGLLTMWGKLDSASVTGWLLVALMWLVVLLAASAVQVGVR
jgi:high-affinity Fe2+/Pb2+ permease